MILARDMKHKRNSMDLHVTPNLFFYSAPPHQLRM